MIKLVASDIDGTLLLGKKRVLSPEIYEIILELKKKGIIFVASSGRQLANMHNLFSPIDNEIFYVAENGAICEYQGKVVRLFELERQMAMRILHEVGKFPECKVAIATLHTQYIKSGDEEFYNSMTGFFQYHTTPIDSFEDIEEPILKIAFHNKEKTEEYRAYFENMFKNEMRVATSGNNWVDFISLDSNKGIGVKYLLEQLGISTAEAMCFGDQQNDVEMLDLIEESYAMEHANLEVKKHAKYTTASVEETLLELLQNNGENRCNKF